MRLSLAPLAALAPLVALALPACAPAAVTPALPTPVAELPAAPVAVVAPRGPLVSIPLHPQTLALGRIRAVRDTLAAADQVLRLPVSLVKLASGMPEFEALMPGASIDLMVLLDPASTDEEPSFALGLSFPISSEGALRNMVARTPDLISATRSGFTLGQGDDAMVCELGPAVGEVDLRLVCAPTRPQLALLSQQMRLALPAVAIGPETDLRLNLRAAPLTERYLPLLKEARNKADWLAMAGVAASGTPGLAALTASVSDALDEAILFPKELDQLSIGGRLDGKMRQLDLDVKLTLRGKNSWFSRAMTGKLDPAGKAPQVLWELPREALLTLHGPGLDGGLLAPPRRFLQRAAAVVLPRSGEPQDARVVDAFLAATPAFDAPWALGRLPSPRRPAPRGDVFVQAQHALAQASGLVVLGVEQPAAGYAAWIRSSSGVLRQLAHPSKPGSERAMVIDSILPDGRPAVRLDESPAGLPRGSLVAEFSLPTTGDEALALASALAPQSAPPAAPAKKGKLSLFVMVVPDGDSRSWVALGFDRADLRKSLLASLASAPQGGKLAARTDLDELHGPGVAWGGMVQLGPLLEEAFPLLAASSQGGLPSPVSMAFSMMPNRLATPLVLLGSGASGDRPALTLDLRLTHGTFEDLSALAPLFPMVSRFLKP